MAYCCANCFSDDILKKHIADNGMNGDCDYCGSTQVNVVAPEDMEKLFEPVVSLYAILEDLGDPEELREYEGRYIWEVLSEDWGIFDDALLGKHIIEEMFNQSDPTPRFLSSWVEDEDAYAAYCEDRYLGHSNDLSSKQINAWGELKNEIIAQNRFFLKNKLDLGLLKGLLDLVVREFPRDIRFFRARLCEKEKKFPPSKMGCPPREEAVDGRANPRGIPYLYLASDSDTAIAEIRPYFDDLVTVGSFRSKDSLKVVDLAKSSIGSPFPWGDKLKQVLDYWRFLTLLSGELSKPIGRKSSLDYLPTQYFCELIKHLGYDGVLYKSHLANGTNICLFHDDKVKCTRTNLYKVESVAVKAGRASIAPKLW